MNPSSRGRRLRCNASLGLDDLLAGTSYRLLRRLGQGGMGEVYVVEERFIGRKFALKVLSADLAATPQLVDRMRLEAQALGRLQHPNVVEVVDFWTSPDGRPCLVMELLEGRTLAKEVLVRRRLPPLEAVEWARQLLDALDAAHALGVVHRDLKPENLYLHDVPGYGRRVLKVLDFGLARVFGQVRGGPRPLDERTRTGALVGSPRFMSPEQARGERVDHRADLYAVGLVLYELLAGRGPFDEGAVELEAPSRYASGEIAPALDALVERALCADPDQRFQGAAELRRALDEVTPPAWRQPGLIAGLPVNPR